MSNSPRFQIRKAHSGFTLIELLMVVLIISMIAVFAGRSFSKTYQRLKVEQSAKEIVLAAKYARMTAIEQQSTIRLQFNRLEGGIAVLEPGPDGSYGRLGPDPFFKPRSLEDGVIFESIETESTEEWLDSSNGKDVVLFNPDGSNDKALIIVGDGRTFYTIQIYPATGKIKITRGFAEFVNDVIDLDV